MIILSHRGFWIKKEEKNTDQAFVRSFENGFGIETDVRDYKGEIVISHDIPNGNEMKLEDLLKIMNGRNLLLALNIKADGLCEKIVDILNKYNHTNYFTFDMSLPELYQQEKKKIKVFTGMSDINKNPPLIEQSEGVWMDAFDNEWYKTEDIIDILKYNKKVCIVSNELHNRDNKKQWEMIKNSQLIDDEYKEKLLLCTDKPKEAQNFFNL